jgi:hypothetical protein
MKNIAWTCDECGMTGHFDVPREPKNPMHRRALRSALLNFRKSLSRNHWKLHGCRSTRFQIGLSIEPVKKSCGGGCRGRV